MLEITVISSLIRLRSPFDQVVNFPQCKVEIKYVDPLGKFLQIYAHQTNQIDPLLIINYWPQNPRTLACSVITTKAVIIKI